DPDFRRGRGGTRGRPRSSRAKAEAGVRRGGGKAKRGPRAAIDPGAEYKRFQDQATLAYLRGDLEDALEYARQAVQQNPEIFASHSLISEIYGQLGKPEESLFALKTGAHTARDPKIWWDIVNLTLELGGNDQEVNEEVYRCYSQIISLDPKDYDARLERLKLQLELGLSLKAKRECESMLKLRPYDMEVLRQYAELCVTYKEPGSVEKAKSFYEDAIEYFNMGGNSDDEEFTWSHLNVYLDLIGNLKDYAEAITKLKALSRWMLGRKDASYWDNYQDDDREWDVDDEPRRLEVEELIRYENKYPEETYGEGLPLELRVKMGIFRLNLGPSHLAEAMYHFDFLDPDDDSPSARVFDYDDLFRDVADVLWKRAQFTAALRFYEPLQNVSEALNVSYYMSVADCYRALNRLDDAEECYQAVIRLDSDDIPARVHLAKLYEEMGQAGQAFQMVTEVMRLGRKETERKGKLEPPNSIVVPETAATSLEEPLEEASPAPASTSQERRRARLPETKPGRQLDVSHAQVAATKAAYERMVSVRGSMSLGDEDAVEEWMDAAWSMIQDFRNKKAFYPIRDKYIKFTGFKNRNMNPIVSEMEAMADRLQAGMSNELDMSNAIPKEFRDIPFDEWLDIFCEYAVRLAKRDEQESAYEILQAAVDANVFCQHDERIKLIQLTWLACALHFNDENVLCTISRWFIRRYPYASSTYQLYAAMGRLHAGAPNWYNSGPSQKFILRQVKALDYAILDPQRRRSYAFVDQERSSYTAGGRHDGNPHALTGLDAGALVLYGHLLAVAGSYSNALNYYFRAYALQPRSPLINLVLATTYVQHAMKRQSENRQYQIAQGLAFLFAYRDLRTKDARALHCQEAEFNVARTWHLLGLTHLAIPGYEKCLALSERVRQEGRQGGAEGDGDGEGEEEEAPEDFAREAAFALQSILAVGGDMEAARRIAEKWFVV
ncbi:transcription factor tfiiic complex subunit sfc4, partial [Cryomyces antarcticus]